MKLTPTRLAVLNAIAAGNVKHHRSWTGNKKDHDKWQVDEYTTKDVTRICTDLANATPRLARLGRRTSPSILAPQVWELTADGEMLLAAHNAKEA
ncbi:hypothetical protein ACFYUR_18970 [Micromonospora haikouensis]|uniref:hypothetical protein n=1 Tax=Micromonospora haikouensis TaxID=686309 RepID=UPI0036B88F8A